MVVGGTVTVFCDADISGVPEEGTPEGIYVLALGWNGKTYELSYNGAVSLVNLRVFVLKCVWYLGYN